MNKILVSDIIDLNNDSYIINSKNNKIVLNILGNVKVYLINEVIDDITFDVKEKSNLDIYLFNKNVNNNLVINIKERNDSLVNLNFSIINNANRELIVNNDMIGNNSKSVIKGRIISNKDLIKVIINVNVFSNTLNNIALEDLKGINNGGFVQIEPNITCLTNDVSANHLTSIGNLNKDMVSYLMSKGLNEQNAKNLMLKGFIYSNMDEYIKNLGDE